MKIFIIFAMVLNLFLITNSSKNLDFGTGENTKGKVDKILLVEPEEITIQLNQDPMGQIEINKFVKEQGSLPKYEVKDGKARIVPLFTSFNYQEPKWQEQDILIELKEEEAINLYLFSNLYKNMMDLSQRKDDNGYCEATYAKDFIDQPKKFTKKSKDLSDQHTKNELRIEARVDACKAIRSADFSINSFLITQVHSTYMKMILEFVNKKDGVAPPEEGYVTGLSLAGFGSLEDATLAASSTWSEDYVVDNIKTDTLPTRPAAANSLWHSRGGTNNWITMKFPYDVKLGGFRVKRPYSWDNTAFKGYSFQVSDDQGGTWTDVHSGIGQNQRCCDFQTITFDTSTTGNYFRLFMESNHGYGHHTISYMELLKKDETIQLGNGMSSPENFDVNFVNEIWDHNMRDVNYVLFAANYLEINSLAQLMGARIGQEIMLCSLEELMLLADMNLKNEFLHY